MDHEAAPTAKAALVMMAAFMKLFVDKGLLAEADLQQVVKDAAQSVSGTDDEAAVISVLNHLSTKPT